MMSGAIVFQTLFLVVGARKQLVNRVIAGEDDLLKEYPYVVALACPVHSNFIRTCTGSVITENWVLTAAHCVTDQELQKKGVVLQSCRVVYDNLKIPPDLTDHYKNVIKAVIHPQNKILLRSDIYGTGEDLRIRNDIALIMIEYLKMDIIGRVAAYDYRTLIGHSVVYVGAGGTFTDHDMQHNRQRLGMTFALDQIRPLQIGKGVVMACNDKLKPIYYPALCISPKCHNKGQRIQKGDSGGPVIYRGKIIGVCISNDHNLAIYTPVSTYFSWIKHVIDTTTVT